jgi:hypothetical protein
VAKSVEKSVSFAKNLRLGKKDGREVQVVVKALIRSKRRRTVEASDNQSMLGKLARGELLLLLPPLVDSCGDEGEVVEGVCARLVCTCR